MVNLTVIVDDSKMDTIKIQQRNEMIAKTSKDDNC